MSRYLNNPGEVPPGGFRFTQPETGVTVRAPSWKELLVNVQQHRRANTLPIGSNFDREIEDALCAQLPEESCTGLDPKRTPEVARTDWPMWAKAIALMANDSDAGVGSTVERVIGPFGGEAFKKFYEATFHKPCGCAERASSWNAQFPYNSTL